MKRSLTHVTFAAFATSLAAGGITTAQAEEAAAPAAPTSLIARRCQAEAAKLCSGIEPGGGKLAKCLRGHEAELTDPCRAALAAGWRKGRAFAPAAAPAEPATAAVTAPTPPPPPPAAATGKPPKAGPEPGPRPRPGMGMSAPSAWGPMAGMRKTCSAEIGKLCRDVKPGHGRIAVCLDQHAQELSPPCKASVAQVTHQMNAPMEMHRACAADIKKLCDDVRPGTGRVAFCLGEHAAELTPDCKRQVAEMKDTWGKRGFGPPKGSAGPAAARPAAAPAKPAGAASAPPPAPKPAGAASAPPPPAAPRPAPSAPPPPPARAPAPPPAPAPHK